MRLYRVTWADPSRWSRLPQHRPGPPLFVALDQQGRGRFDNPGRYAALYLARTPEAAVGETYGAWPVWSDSMFRNADPTQETALKLWLRRTDEPTQGLCCWSYWRAEWRLVMLWCDGLASAEWFPHVAIQGLEPLTVEHDAVQIAADVLPRYVDRTTD